jgi:DNA polymerase IV (DinB-like DNA polymerase)
MLLLRGFEGTFEQLGIDEAFLDVSKKVRDYVDAEELARRVKSEVLSKEGLTCSIGVGPSKSVAKIASDFQKPDGLSVVAPDRVKEFLGPLSVSKISGVGKKTEEVLNGFGIRTIGQLAVVPGRELVRIFGKNGIWLWAIANGLEETPVEERPPVKSISMEQTFEKDVPDVNLVVESLLELSEEVHRRAVTENVLFRTVGIKVRYKGFTTFTREKSLQDYTQQKHLIVETVRSLFREFEKSGKEFRLVGVRLSNLKAVEAKQESLYSWAGPEYS